MALHLHRRKNNTSKSLEQHVVSLRAEMTTNVRMNENESLPVDLNGRNIAVVLEDERLQSVGLHTAKEHK